MTKEEREALVRVYGDEWSDEELASMNESTGETIETLAQWLEENCPAGCECFGCQMDRMRAKKANT